ncbi:MAG TPA: tetratricopeptide repeat protein [Terracidiphilus sp.]|nr:tetratricopeptide repeat protein [Terracidiphilus sp.]
MKFIPAFIARRTLPATGVYGVAAGCLVAGLIAGYALRAWRAPAPAARATAVSSASVALGAGHMPTLQEMKQMADKQAAPLVEKLKTDPNNSTLLVQIGGVYHAAHQFSAAATYFSRAAQADPSNVAIRSKLAASLYRGGDADGAIAQLKQALHYSPTDANTLFNLGLIRWQGKQDAEGALSAWQQLLKFNPGLSPDRKATVQHLIAEVKAGQRGEAGAEGGVHP